MYEVHFSHIGPNYVTNTIRLHRPEWGIVTDAMNAGVETILGHKEFEIVKDFNKHYVILVGTTPVGCITVREI